MKVSVGAKANFIPFLMSCFYVQLWKLINWLTMSFRFKFVVSGVGGKPLANHQLKYTQFILRYECMIEIISQVKSIKNNLRKI